MTKNDFTIFPKKLSSGNTIYYYWLYDDAGKRRQFSTGKSEYNAALKECRSRLFDEKLIPDLMTRFDKFTENWFIAEKCPYCLGKAIRGYTLTTNYVNTQRMILETHILPYFRDTDIRMVNRIFLEKWLIYLSQKGLSNTSINHYITTLNLILSEAYKQRIISNNPLRGIQRFKNDTREKGILSENEWKMLFLSDRKHIYWQNSLLAYTFCLLSSIIGMRRGEIQGLRWENVSSDHIQVKHSWGPYGLKCTKTGKERVIPIALELFNLLKCCSNSSNGYIFSNNGGETPMDHKVITKRFYYALERIGIDENERKRRNISLHSFRHFANTRLRASGLPDVMVQAVTGHSDIKMSNHYTHIQIEDLEGVLLFQKKLLA